MKAIKLQCIMANAEYLPMQAHQLSHNDISLIETTIPLDADALQSLLNSELSLHKRAIQESHGDDSYYDYVPDYLATLTAMLNQLGILLNQQNATQLLWADYFRPFIQQLINQHTELCNREHPGWDTNTDELEAEPYTEFKDTLCCLLEYDFDPNANNQYYTTTSQLIH